MTCYMYQCALVTMMCALVIMMCALVTMMCALVTMMCNQIVMQGNNQLATQSLPVSQSLEVNYLVFLADPKTRVCLV